MEILIVASTEEEIFPFLEAYPRADHLITGVGTAMTTYHLTKRLHQVEYNLVIQAGVAGSFGDMCPLESLVMVQRDCFAGSGIMEDNEISSLFEKGLWTNEKPFVNGMLVNSHELLSSLPFKKVSAATVDFLTDNALHNGKVYAKYAPDIESMEGAALHYVCIMEEVPFLQLRAISNFVGERNKTNWKLKEAIQVLNNGLIMLYEQLKAHETKH